MILLCIGISLTAQYTLYVITANIYTTRIWNSNPFPGMICLQGGKYSIEELVVVYYNGQCRTMSDDGFNSTDANTICKQLRYTGYTNYDHLIL